VQQLEPGQLAAPRVALRVLQQRRAPRVVAGQALPDLLVAVDGCGTAHATSIYEHVFCQVFAFPY